VKFIADVNLGKLVKWLRILGYDTAYWRGCGDRDLLRKAEREGRLVLTRKRDIAKRQFSGSLIVIQADHVQEQLGELSEKLSLHPEPEQFFRICLKCNELLLEVQRKDVAGRVPAYVFETNTTFRTCPRCGGIFWPGTHRENMLHLFRTRIPIHRP
jgi:uncharacterized protein with PIN domain